jgi:hypothetical protein
MGLSMACICIRMSKTYAPIHAACVKSRLSDDHGHVVMPRSENASENTNTFI